MSQNFELLSQLELAGDLFSQAKTAPIASEADTRPSGICGIPTDRSEAVNLVQRVFLSKSEAPPRMVVFTSAQSGDGCSWVCARTCETLANRLAGTVCVVDANLRSPAMHKLFRVDNTWGLTQALFKDDSILKYVREVPDRNLWVLPSGPLPQDHPAPWPSDQLAVRLGELRKAFGFVLIDSPAVNLYADVTQLSSLVDGAILVLGADSTRRAAAIQARDALTSAKFRLLGAALNKRTFPIPEFLYSRL